MEDNDRYLKISSVAEMFDVSAYTVREWLKSGKIQGVKLNGRWRILKSEAVKLANTEYGGASDN